MKGTTIISFRGISKYLLLTFVYNIKMLINYIIIGIGGAIGSVLRYVISGLFQNLLPFFPFGTFVVNLTGSFFFGFIAGLTNDMLYLNPQARNFIFAGILGAFTTFSTFTWESFNLLREGSYYLFLWNTLGSLVAGILMLALGIFCARMIGGLL